MGASQVGPGSERRFALSWHLDVSATMPPKGARPAPARHRAQQRRRTIPFLWGTVVAATNVSGAIALVEWLAGG